MTKITINVINVRKFLDINHHCTNITNSVMHKGIPLLYQRLRVGVAGGYEFDKLLKDTTILDSSFSSI